jgi:hypothetical protein
LLDVCAEGAYRLDASGIPAAPIRGESQQPAKSISGDSLH